MVKKAKKVLLIGWDAADWKVINPLLDSGQMPTLQKIVDNGMIGNIATLDPPLSPMLWTSIATGKRADKHGILGFIEADTVNGGVRNVNSTSRKSRALWNILHHKGYKSNVISWWPSHPAEPINGVMVSNFYQRANNKVGKPWLVPKNAIYPAEMTKVLAPYRVHPAELTEQHILPFIPLAAEVDQEKDKRLEAMARIIADTATVQSTATYLMENTEWDFTAVYFDGIDHFCHGFMKFHPPQLPGLPDDLFRVYKDVVVGAYKFHDMLLERLLQLAGEDCLVMIVSDHGFHSDHLRPIELPKFAAAPALEHNPYGIICMYGPNIKKDDRIYGATLLDITPTLLAAMGLPLGKDMDGKVLMNAFENPPEIKYIDSWETVEGDFGEHPKHMKENTEESAEALQQLIELGYIEDPGEDKMKAMERAEKESKYNLAKVYLSKNDITNAVNLFEELLKKEDSDIRFNIELANCYLQLKQFKKVREIVDRIKGWDETKDEFKNKKFINLDIIEAKLLFAENKPLKAQKILEDILSKNPLNQAVLSELGKIYRLQKNYKKSIDCYSNLLQIDSENASAYLGLSLAFLRLENYTEAAEQALNAIGLTYHYPLAHYTLGEALYHMGKYLEAAQALELTLIMSPSFFKARQWLLEIYQDKIPNKEKYTQHKTIIDKQMKGRITVVSGLPRSGTSMMMQMLEKGGMTILTDKNRKADENNPKGYYEDERVKAIGRDNSWLEEADGKVIKVIAQLLQHLPAKYEYDILFMQRDMDEILTSQQKMLKKDPKVYPTAIANAFSKELLKVEQWAKTQPNVRIKYVKYSDCIDSPEKIAEEVNLFLGNKMDAESMSNAIDAKLYRNRLEKQD
jgi:predicted AlkP superfamily phosphohydrolase/phosphomutase/tetratricopeptide (TPR) repeat protein